MSSSSDPVPRPSLDRTADLVHNLQDIRDRVRRAASTSSSTSNGAQINREPTLVAVSKYKPASDVLACYDVGQRDFGENYVQELVDKAAALPDDIRWHFIGTLQSNKAKLLASIPNIDTVQTLTSAKAATALNNGLPPSRPSSSPLNILIQVNTSGEAAKSGVSPPDSDESSDSKNNDLIDLARHILNRCPRLRLRGLMTIGSLERSLDASAGEENADFARLIRARDALHEALEAEFGPDADGKRKWGDDGQGRGLVLSMGMSADFEAALVAGSDIVRVGTGIFGERRKKGEVVEG